MTKNITAEPAFELSDRVAIVTGASRGIGRAVAIALADHNVKVACVARTSEDLEHTVNACKALGGVAKAYPFDLTGSDPTAQLVESISADLGPISVLVHNAGVLHRGSVADLDLDDVEETMGVNVEALFGITRHAATQLIEEKGAVIVIASISGKMGVRRNAAYSASKHAAIGFAASAFEDLREHGIKVSAICPGYVNTVMVEDRDDLDPTRMIQPDDVADAVLYVLCSSETVCPTEIVLRPQRTPRKA